MTDTPDVQYHHGQESERTFVERLRDGRRGHRGALLCRLLRESETSSPPDDANRGDDR